MFVLHTGPEPLYEFVQGVGMFTFPPNETVEIKDDFIGESILRHQGKMGLVQVPLNRSNGGIQFDIEAAKKASVIARRQGRKAMLDRYIKSQLEDRIAVGKPAIPPSKVVQKIIIEDGIDLGKWNIHPVGWDQMENAPVNKEAEELAKLREENAALRKTLQDKLAALESQVAKRKTG